MATPRSGRFAITPSSRTALSLTPGSRVLSTPIGDETIWKRLKEAGLDEESIRKRDKAALIAYIANLEAQLFDHEHHMGLLILERKELISKYEQIKISNETAEIFHKRDQASEFTALAEAKKREESLKKAIGIKDECIASIEKALHEMRVESAETKVTAESRLAEARAMVEDAERKRFESEAKIRAAEALHEEANRYHRAAERKMQEIKEREADLNERNLSFISNCDKKEEEIAREKQSLSERQETLRQESERLLDGQSLLNQREDYIFHRSQELNRLEKALEELKANVEQERKSLNDEKSKHKLTEASLSRREADVIKRECFLSQKEQDLLILQEKLATKESDEIQKAVANHKVSLRARTMNLDAELETKKKMVEVEIDFKRRAWELRDMDLKQREDVFLEKEHELEVHLKSLANKEKELGELSLRFEEKEKSLKAAQQEVELNRLLLQNEKEEFTKMKLDLQISLDLLEEEKKRVDCEKNKFEAIRNETNELSHLEMQLKKEIDSVRDQKLEVMTEAEKLKGEKEKFEAEWELIDEKREELRKEVEHIAAQRIAVSIFIKDERESLRVEREAIREEFKHNSESLCHEREEFMNKMLAERSEWLNKMQQERTNLLFDIDMQKKELENCLEQRRGELESDLREKVELFNREKKNELQYVSSLKERVANDMEHVQLEMKRLETERMEINLDREKRNREWAELNDSIEELRVQREKLEKQRELLRADREEILSQIEELKKFEVSNVVLDNEMQKPDIDSSLQRSSAKRFLKHQASSCDLAMNLHNATNINNGFESPSMKKLDSDYPPSVTRFSWIKRCKEMIFKYSPERPSTKKDQDKLMGDDAEYALGEPKVIIEALPACGNTSRTHVLKSENKQNANRPLAGRKRLVSNSATSDDYIDPLEQVLNKKKQKQQEHTVGLSGDDLIFREEGTQSRVIGDQLGLSLSTQIHEGAGETEKIMDDINKVSEVPLAKTSSDYLADLDKSNHRSPSVDLEHDIFWNEVINSHSTSHHLNAGLLPCSTEAQEIIQDIHLGDVGQLADFCQLTPTPGDT